MVRIRLRRTGAKKQPHYRVVVADSRSPRDGRHIEVIGHYNPRTEPETVMIQEDRALYWLSKGAQPSDVVLRFLEKQGTMARLARLKAGESLEALVAEYEAAVEEPVEEAVEAEPIAEVAEVEASAEAEPIAEVAEVEASAEEEPVAEVAEVEANAQVDLEPVTETTAAEAEPVESKAETPADQD